MNGDLQVLTVIKTRLLRRGSGVEADDPIRIIEQWWDMDGRLLFQVDTWNGEVEHGLVASRLASLIFTALAAFFIGKGDQPEAVIYTALAAVWFWIAQIKLAQYKEEKK